MRKTLNNFYIYFGGIVLLAIITENSGQLYKIFEYIFLIWILGFPLYFLISALYKKFKEKGPWPVELKATKQSISVIIVGLLNLIPTISFFLFGPIMIYCSVSFIYYVIQQKKRSSIFSGVGLGFAILGTILLMVQLSIA